MSSTYGGARCGVAAKRIGSLGTDDAAGERLASETDHSPTLAERSLRRHTPEVGAVCGKAARTVLCGGRSVMSVPTASDPLCCDALGPFMVEADLRLTWGEAGFE